MRQRWAREWGLPPQTHLGHLFSGRGGVPVLRATGPRELVLQLDETSSTSYENELGQLKKQLCSGRQFVRCNRYTSHLVPSP